MLTTKGRSVLHVAVTSDGTSIYISQDTGPSLDPEAVDPLAAGGQSFCWRRDGARTRLIKKLAHCQHTVLTAGVEKHSGVLR